MSRHDSGESELGNRRNEQTNPGARSLASTIGIMMGIGLLFGLVSVVVSIHTSREAPMAPSAGARASSAFDVGDWTGKRVVPKSSAFRLHSGEAVEEGDLFRPFYRVKSAEGIRLTLEAEQSGQSGWEYSEHVIAAHDGIAFFTQQISSNPRDVFAFGMRAALHFDYAEIGPALDDFDEAIRLDPKCARTFYDRGVARMSKSDYDGAIDDLKQVIRLDPTRAAACSTPLIMNYYKRGLRRLAEKEFDPAIADFGEVIRLDPRDAEALKNRGLAWAGVKDYDRAIAEFSRALEVFPDLKGAHLDRGLAYSKQKRYDEAIADLSEAIRRRPTSAKAYAARGTAWRAKHERGKALADLDRAIELEPGAWDFFLLRGTIWLETKCYDNGIADFTRASGFQPRHELPYYFRGRAWMCKGDLDRAILDFDQAIRFNPQAPPFYDARAEALLLKGAYNDAIADLDRAAQSQPKLAGPRTRRVMASFVTRRSGVVEEVKEALALKDPPAEAPVHLALLGYFASLRAGNDGQARAFLDDAANRCSPSAWPYPIVKHLRGGFDESKLFAAAANDKRKADAYCFVGLKLLQDGQKDAAVARFKWVHEHGDPEWGSYLLSVGELNRLEAAKK